MLSEKKLFLFDIDGTLSLGDELFESSREFLEYINANGGKSYFITNNSTKSAVDYVRKFEKWNIETSEEDFITAGYVAQRFLHENYNGKKVFTVGTKSFLGGLEKQGIMVTENIDDDIACVLIGFDSELTYKKAQKACEILQIKKDIPFYATNPDLRCPVPFGFIPDCGAICKLIECTVDRKPIFLGKPNRIMVDICVEKSGFTRAETLVVGDRLYTDIACGINANVETCLLYTGEARPEDIKTTEYKPDFAFDTIDDLYKACL